MPNRISVSHYFVERVFKFAHIFILSIDITEAIKKWLPSCDFEGKHNDIFLSCFKFLGRWLLEDEVFRSWAIGGRPWYFRLFGKEGTGKVRINQDKTTTCAKMCCKYKTVLSSIVINYLQEDIETKKNPVIYLYLDETDPTTHVLENLFGSLLRQLLDRKPFTATSELQKFYRKGEAKANHWREICGLLKTEILTYDRVYLIVDGLYECQQTQVRTKLERQLVELHKLHSTQLCLMITMRMTRELRENILFCDKCGRQGLRIYFTCSICKVDLCQICRDKGITCDDKSHPMSEPYTAIEVELELRDCDIEQYIRHRIDDNGPELWDKRISTDHPNATVLGRECRRDPKYLQTIVSRITNKAEGILLSAKLYMDQLMCAKNRKDINTILDSLSSGLDKSYAAAMLRIQNQEELENQEIGFHVLALVSQARRPLGLEELLHVLATEPGDRDFDQDKSYDKRLILSATNGLINISDYDKIVRVHHSSLYLYLAKTLDKWFPNVKTDIAKKCLTYLNWDAFSKPPQDYMEFNSREQSYPFIAYASQYWGDHVREAGPDSSIDEMVARFLDDPSRVTAIIQAALYSISWGIDAWDVWKGVTDLHVCAWYGLFSVLSARLEKGTRLQIDVRESTYMQTPLMYACRRGQVEVARQLLDRGADINLVSSRGRTALLEAVIQDQTEVVEMLLERQNLNINAVNTKEHNRTALMLAACLGQSEIVDSLLTHGAQPNLQDEDGYTALWLAVNAQEEDTVKVLLENSKVDGRIDIDLADRIGRTPFIVAAMKNNCDIVELLHKHHANPSIKDKQGRGNAIIRAIDHRSKNVVEWMLDHLEEAVIQCSDDDGRGVLHAASFSGNTDMVDLLAEDERIDINKQDNYGRTPLHAASEEGHLKIVETLIDYDADVAIKDDFDRTPLTIATQYGRTEIASLLLGKDEDQQSNPHHTVNTETSPIWLLVKIGRADLVLQSITKRKGDFSEKEPVSNNTALHCAVLYNRVDLLRILLNNIDSGPNPIDRNKRTPLHQAAVNGFLECTTVLLNHGADVNVEDKWQCTPLHLARSSSRQRDEHLRVAVTLIEAGADTKPTEIQEMFFAAVELGRIAAVQILMDRGADVLGRDDEDKTAYEYARDAGNIEMMKILQPKISRGSEVESGTSGRRVHRVRARKKILSSERVGQAGKEAQEIEGS